MISDGRTDFQKASIIIITYFFLSRNIIMNAAGFRGRLVPKTVVMKMFVNLAYGGVWRVRSRKYQFEGSHHVVYRLILIYYI
jgi:hypothetical protein